MSATTENNPFACECGHCQPVCADCGAPLRAGEVVSIAVQAGHRPFTISVAGACRRCLAMLLILAGEQVLRPEQVS